MSLSRRAQRLEKEATRRRAVVGEPFVRLAALAGSRERHGTGPSTPSTYEERAGVLITKTAAPEGMDPQRLDRLWQRLAPRGRPRAPRPAGWAPRSPVRGALVLGALLLSTGGVVAAATGVWQWPRTIARTLSGPHRVASGVSAPGPRSLAAPSRARAGIGAGVAAGPTTIPPMEAAVAAPDTSPVPTTPAPSRVQQPALRTRPERKPISSDGSPPAPFPISPPSVVSSPLPAPSALAAESALLARALAYLRQARDPAAALRELDQYTERFPDGVLAREAQAARIDALLLAGRSAEAGRVIGGLSLGDGARELELRLIRAELGASGGACVAAIGDFQRVIEQAKRPSLVERALWGRAACYRRLGDETRARADLATYLARFPDGPRAAAARAGGDG